MKARLILGAVTAVGASLFLGHGRACAYPRPTAAEIDACIGDAFRLCIPRTGIDPGAVFRCLRADKRVMSEACRAVFERHGL